MSAAALPTNEAILSLPPSEVARHPAAEVEGVLLMVDPDGFYVLHDGQSAIFASFPHAERPATARGDRVRVAGVAKPGLFAPILEIQHLTRLGTADLPPPIRTRLSGLMNPRLNPQWVEIEGVVRSAQIRAAHENDAVISVAADELRVPVVLSGVVPAIAQQWIDARVRIRAFCFHDTNRRQQLLGPRLLVPQGEPVVILTPPPSAPYSQPIQAPADLLRYSRAERTENRVHLQGVVTQAIPPQTFYLQAASEGIEVQSARTEIPKPGSLVDVIGFVTGRKTGPLLEDADYRVLGHLGKPAPRRITPDEAIDADNTLVQIEGVVENIILETDTVTLALNAGEHRFLARLPRPPESRNPWPLRSRLRVTGICRAEPAPRHENDFAWTNGQFNLLVQSPEDVATLELPPWWTRPIAGQLASLTLLAAAVASILLFVRYRSKAKTEELTRLAAEREFSAVLKERSRVAREIHDTLAQGLTSISAQLELARQNAAGSAPLALGHIDLAREFVRGSLAEARRSVWAMRPQLLERMQLVPALERIGQELTQGTGIEVRMDSTGELENLPPYLEDELLRIGQEALTNAVRHGSPRSIHLQLDVSPKTVRLRIVDDGKGFSPEQAVRSSRQGFGLSGIEERVRLLKGQFKLRSSPGSGTELVVEISMV